MKKPPSIRFSVTLADQEKLAPPFRLKKILQAASLEGAAGRDYLLLHSGKASWKGKKKKWHFFAARPRYALCEKSLLDFKAEISYSLDAPIEFLKCTLKNPKPFESALLKLSSTLPFVGGWLGFFSYDYKNWLEEKNLFQTFPKQSPSFYLVAYEKIELYLETETALERYVIKQNFEKEGFETLETKPLPAETPPAFYPEKPVCETAEQFKEKVEKIKEEIKNGALYQVNLSRKVTGIFEGEITALAEALFIANPNPYEALLKFGDHHLLSTSPERFFCYRAGEIITNPIKGSMPRGKTPEEARQQKTQLLTSLKEEAELAMIVDLLRNDFHKLCEVGTVKVTRWKGCLEYKNIYHLYAELEGRTKAGMVEVLEALFPGGSISGTPKIKAAQMIDALEGEARGTYTGALGYFSLHGKAEFSLLIRSVLFYKKKYLLRSGGGITLRSEAEKEYVETVAKTHFLETLLNNGTGAR